MSEGDTLLTGDPGDGGDQTEAEALAAFRETIPEAYRENPSMAVIKNMDGLCKSYVESQKIIGVPTDRLVTIPNPETAEDSDWQSYYNKLGRPETAEGYKLKAPEMPDGVKVNEANLPKVAEVFHKYGLTPQQAQGVFADYTALALEDIAATNKQNGLDADAALVELKKDWGKAWDSKLDTAKRAMVTFGTEEFREWLDSTKLGDDPMLLRVFSSIGEKLMETATDGGGDGSSFRTLSPAEAKAEISALQADENFTKAYTNRQHPGHQDAVDKMTRLFEYANPDDAAA